MSHEQVIEKLELAIEELKKKKHKDLHCVAVLCQYQGDIDDYRLDLHYC